VINPVVSPIKRSWFARRIRRKVAGAERVLPRLEPGRRVPTILLQGETGTGKGLLTSATSMYGEMDMRAWLEQAEAEAKDSGA